ncbi:hypothetical protein L596_020651 [Steinernema carpocapsae]|uniref:Uncharacterized protein n=1 Tax=Steinernema carpocapsae TaxID=34508 RepID=A0A4U5MU65_STECR|nr:hypothetical protein L596_020651 [Steinernema carpocapsae]
MCLVERGAVWEESFCQIKCPVVGAGGVIYLIFNKVIRKAVLQFWPWHRKTMQGSSMVFAIGHPSTPRNAHEL